jgi:hypothetical protein
MICLFRAFTAGAANHPNADKGSLSGKVVDELDGLSIPSAIVSIYLANAEQPLFTTPTDENGNFKFDALDFGIYKLKVSYVGYAPLILSDIILNKKESDKDLGTLKLGSDQNNLAEVTITASKPAIEFGADMITYNVDQSILAEGSTATDLLKNVPMVQIDIDGNATIAGKRSTRLFIDGKPSDYMTSNIADLLNVLPSEAVEKIEVMTNPPARYSGDGEGIINIVMKKGFKLGFNGSLGATAGLQENTNVNANAAYKGNKYSVNGSATYRQSVRVTTNNSLRTNFRPDTTFYYDQYNDNQSVGSGGNLRGGLNWDITPTQSLRVSANMNINNSESDAFQDFHYLDEQRIQTRLRNQLNTYDGRSNSFVFNADYSVRIDTSGAKLEIGLSVNGNTSNSDRIYDRSFAPPAKPSPTLQFNQNGIGNDGIHFNLDFDKPLFEKRDRLELGLQYNYRKNDNDLLVQNFDFDDDVYLINPNLTNRFLYNEHIIAGYASYNYRKDGWSVKPGIRTELTDVDFDLSTGNKFDVKPYVSVFPNLSINRFFRKRYNIGATYSVRVNRPRETTLNPQINNNDPLNISYGNPDLNPAYTHQFSLSFGMFGNSWSFTPRLSYSSSNGVIERYRMVSDEGVSETTYDNVGNNKSAALILIGNYRPHKNISTNATFNIIESRYSSKLNEALNRNGLSLRGTLGLSMQLPFRTAFESNLNYANNINAQGRTKGSVESSFGARKNFFKNKLMARVMISDPLGRRNSIIYNTGTNFLVEGNSYTNTNNISFSLSYRFSNMKKVTVPPAPKP